MKEATSGPKENPNKEIRIEKVVLNIGVGEAGEKLDKAKKVIQLLTGRKATQTISKVTNKDLGIRFGMPIGVKVTLRKDEAPEFLRKALWVRENKVTSYSFDQEGNFSFGISDYTDFEGMKYDPQIGIFGLDVNVVLTRAGKRVKIRRKAPARFSRSHRVSKEEAIKWMAETFKVEVLD